ncbi:S-layer homology domain-containing protein [Bacillus anthracis]|uniref:S-layer homology domain-containing protein n=1 Tax=Bacillus anthracis TaxID=1392 RepID=UPI0008FE6381|nr:S-layer homology domain-containing protein [Bacillus anthracis]AXO97989.1 S-layer homology domain-containing protein [Bacillus anthracis]MEB9456514.1 S-layer homology domain-containing protein [Bacillus anthracis]OJD92735.1 S-layer protein [Bacillus anthracis]HDX9623770.1 S-layer homology domain-containing protein [Bacillus anthracis]
MNFKHVLATGLITATLFGATNAYAQTEHFIDVPKDHWSKNSINYLTEQNVISGYGNGKFGFGDNVTRGQVAAIISRYLKLENTGSASKHFSDIHGHMFENSIKAVAQKGLMTGDSSTDKFRPDDTLTRYEMAVILQKAFHLSVKTNDLFYDVPNNFWATDAVRSLYSNGITNGIGNYQYGGKLNVTREQFATFMYNAINVNPHFVPKSIPAKDEDAYKEIHNILIDSGFSKYNYEYQYIKNYSYLMYFYFSSTDDSAYRMNISSEDPVLNEPVKKILNTLLPTKADYLYSLIKNPTASSRTIELDGRKVEISRGSANVFVSLGKRKY